MTHRVCYLQMDVPTYCGMAHQGYLLRHRKALLGAGLFLIVCWTFSAICLISQRQSERSMEDILERKAIVSHILPTETLASR